MQILAGPGRPPHLDIYSRLRNAEATPVDGRSDDPRGSNRSTVNESLDSKSSRISGKCQPEKGAFVRVRVCARGLFCDLRRGARGIRDHDWFLALGSLWSLYRDAR